MVHFIKLMFFLFPRTIWHVIFVDVPLPLMKVVANFQFGYMYVMLCHCQLCELWQIFNLDICTPNYVNF